MQRTLIEHHHFDCIMLLINELMGSGNTNPFRIRIRTPEPDHKQAAISSNGR